MTLRPGTRADVRAAAAVFGIATAAMNTFFYMAIDRTDLGKSVAIEFIGPIVVAAVMTRTRRNAGALVLAVVGVVLWRGGDALAGLGAGLGQLEPQRLVRDPPSRHLA